MKITNRKTTVTLANDFKTKTLDYKKGHQFDARNVTENGLVVTCGHGWNEIIPHDHLGTYEETYSEVTTDGDTKTIKNIKRDVTGIWVAHWKKLVDKKAAETLRAEKARIKKHVANLRATIEYVKKGEAEKELTNLLAELAKLA
jgi:hypothetical protein